MSELIVRGYDFTLPKNDEWKEAPDVHDYLRQWMKKYVFQLEKGESGYVHWQGRGSLIKKARPSTLKGRFCVGGHFSVTNSTAFKTEDDKYVMKAETRVDGPYKSEEYEPPEPKTTQLIEFETHELYPWQQTIVEWCQTVDFRHIKLIYDTKGNRGKSIFAEWLSYRKLANEVPSMRSMEDLLQACFHMPARNAYLIDMPRGMNKGKLGEFYSGLESLKNGMIFDKRYQYRVKRINRPQVIVFTNTLPKFNLLSPDRWQIYEITLANQLRKMDLGDLDPSVTTSNGVSFLA